MRDAGEIDQAKMKMPPIDVSCSCSMLKLAFGGRLGSINLRCGGFLYSAFAETFRAFRGIDFATWFRWLFDLLKPRAIAGGANNLSQNFRRSIHRDHH